MIRAKKFSWNPDAKEAKVVYTIEREGGSRESHTLECADKPTPALLEKLQSLDEMALRECEVIRVADKKERAAWEGLLGEGYMEKNHDSILSKVDQREAFATVRSVSWSWSNDIMGGSVCLLVKLEKSNTPLVVNSPHKPEEPYSEGGSVHLLAEEFAAALRDLHGLVVRFIEGERVKEPSEQTELFEDAEQGEAA